MNVLMFPDNQLPLSDEFMVDIRKEFGDDVIVIKRSDTIRIVTPKDLVPVDIEPVHISLFEWFKRRFKRGKHA